MNRREQIIIGATVLAALYGIYEFILRPQLNGTDAPQLQQGIDLGRVQEMTAVLEQDKELHETVALTLARAAASWRPDAFYFQSFAVDPPEPLEKEPETLPLDPALFVYSGVLQMQDETIAIINGIDYAQNELLEDDYRIEIITPELITLSKNGQTFTLTPKEETDAPKKPGPSPKDAPEPARQKNTTSPDKEKP